MSLNADWLPDCLIHLNDPYLDDGDEYVVVGQLSDDTVRGYDGLVKKYTILVPNDRVEEVLNHPGGIGWKAESWGPGPVVGVGQMYRSDFWVEGPGGSDDRLEPIVVSWDRHNKTVMMPDNGMLMCYGLCPRTLQSPDQIVWDDLSRPQMGVVTVKPLSHYDVYSYSGAYVKMSREYLEDYASLKGCALVSVFFEERRCRATDDLNQRLGGNDATSLKEPGFQMDIVRVNGAVLCRLWGCRLVLTPTGRPVTEEHDPELEWPDYPGVMDVQRAFSLRMFDYVYTSDGVLGAYEGRSEFDVSPLSGTVSYDGWWALGYSHRVGRDYIAYELKKIYEGCPPSVIRHVHKFAVGKAVAKANEEEFGRKNIGTRATTLVYAFLDLGDALLELSDRFDLPFQPEDMIGLVKADVEYQGWWRIQGLAPLGYHVRIDMTKDCFLERCKTIQKLFELLREKSLRRLVGAFEIDKNEVDSYKQMKLLTTVLQCCHVAADAGLDVVEDTGEISRRWTKDLRLGSVTPFFALIDLRNAAGHDLGGDEERKVGEALKVYGVQVNDTTVGYGIALDKVYDLISESLTDIARLVREVSRRGT